MKKLKMALAAFLAGLVLVGCTTGGATSIASSAAGGTTPPPASTGTGGEKTVINLALSENITKLDPHDIFNFPVFTACWMMYDTLIATDHEGNYSAGLATEWSKSEDGLTWTFKLREGVKFQNGEDFDSADVVTTFQRLIDTPELTCALTYWPYLESVTAVDQYTAEVKLSEPFGPAEYAFSNTWIIPNEAWDAEGEKLWTEQKAVGTGPWQLDEWVDGQYTHFTKYEDSWDIYETTLTDVYLRHILEPSTAINGQLSGEIDAYLSTGGVARDMLPMYTGTEDKTEMVNVDVGIFHYLQFQCRDGSVFANEKVREAFSLALDRQALVDYVLGAGSVPNGIFPEGSLGFDSSVPAYEYDLEKAKSLLAEAGYNGEAFTIYTHTGIPMGKQLLTAIQDMLTQAGFNAKIEAVEVSALNNIRKEGTYDVFLASNNYVSGDPYAHINQRILSDNHHSNYQDPAMMQIIEDSNKAVDTADREALLKELNAKMRETYAPQITTDQMQACYPINYGVTGLQLYKDGYINARYVNWDPALVK
ncbi:ABC transporter substrate-binding protein [Ruminococcaceae bacterium OttesenSCG-928-A16]|nr:ABC transporter substrate-binding protein [Ruminococcaceae bacterium OttesenSCG-928-A16]